MGKIYCNAERFSKLPKILKGGAPKERTHSSRPDEIIQIDVDLAGLSGALEPNILEASNKDKSTESETTARRISPRERPEVAKKAAESIQASKALNGGACAIEVLVEQCRKRNQISQEILLVQERNSHINLFPMPGTDLYLCSDSWMLTKELCCENWRGNR